MKPEPQREEALFQAAAQLTGPARSAFLAQACAEDAALRQRLEALLVAHEASVGVLGDEPAHQVLAPTIDLPEPVADEAVGMTLGRYKLREKLGEGGCGTVYVAEQTEPVRRKVALKVIKLGMDTREVIARFEAERQALAMMDHPNIAKVLDAGTTGGPVAAGVSPAVEPGVPPGGKGVVISGAREGSRLGPGGRMPPSTAGGTPAATIATGRPYFVMELVRGIKITEYCDQNQLSTKERLDLFIKVCQAIQHAHQKGIIHRDIKPSNIMVTLHDGVPVPKVIDFGIAKATEGRLVDATVYTQLHHFMGTPAYMSPEQAEMSGLDVDTRSDIYSLGVLLYQLLTSKTPFDGKELLSMGIDAMRKTIREKEPMRPSTRLASLQGEELTTTAKRRSSEAPKLIHQLKGDLDWIVMKALEKDRTRRYETANGLAQDINRYLTNEPVVARPPSTAYRVQKFVRRNRLAVTAGAVVAVTLIVGIVLSSLGFVQAKRQSERAVLSERAATASAQEAKASAEVARTERAQALASDLASRQNAYAADMSLAETAFRAGNLGRARELLEGTRPRPGEADLRDWEWRYLWSSCRSDALFTFAQQSESIKALSFSPDGRQLAVGEHDGTVKIWNVAARKVLKVIPARGQLGAAAFSPRGDRFACAAEANTVALWDAKTWTAQAQLPTGKLRALVFSGDGSRLATLSEATLTNRHAQIWDAGTGQLKTSITAHDGLDHMSLAISPDDRTLASSSEYTNTTIKLWELKTGRLLTGLTNHQRYLSALAFSPDGKWLASGSEDQTIRLWDMETKQEAAVFRGQWSGVSSLAFRPDGKTLASGGTDGSVCFWNVGPKVREKTVVTMQQGSGSGVTMQQAPGGGVTMQRRIGGGGSRRASFTPDSRSILGRGPNAAIVRWDCATGLPSETLSAFGTNNYGLLFSPSGRLLVVGDRLGNLKVMDWVGQRSVTNLAVDGGSDPASPVQFQASESEFISRTFFGSDPNAIIKTWELPAWRLIRSELLLNLCSMPATSPDGRTTVQAFFDGTLKVTYSGTPPTQAIIKAHQADTTTVLAFSPDGKLLASASSDGTIKLWDPVTRTNLATLRGLGSPHSIAFAPNGRRIVTGHSSSQETLNVVYLWDVATHRNVVALPGQGRGFQFVQFSPDGNALLAINDDGLLHLWRAPSWEEIAAAEAEEKRGLPR